MYFGTAFWVLAGSGAATAIAYGLLFLDKPPTLFRALVKTAFLALLTAAFVKAGARSELIIALAAAAAGDFFQERSSNRGFTSSSIVCLKS